MTTNYFNKFKNTKINDTNNLGYALTTSGNIICNGTSNINGNMNITGLGTFIGNSNVLPITNTGEGSGLSIYWNVFTGGTGETSFLNYGQSGPGGFCFYTGNVNTIPKCIAYLETNSNLSRLNNVSCVSITSTGGNTNSNAAITNNSTLSQVGAATFNSLSATSINSSGTLNVSGTSTLTGVLYTYGGITNSNYAIVNNSTLTQVGTSVFADVVRVSPGKSLYISDNTFTNYLRMHHSGAAGYFDCTGGLNFRNGSTDNFNINGTTNQGTFGYNLNTNGITNNTNALINNAVLTQNSTANINSNLNVTGLTNLTSLELGPNGSDFTFIDMKATGGNGDYDCRIGVNAPASGSGPGQGALTINCGSCSMNSNLTTTGNISCNIINATTYNVGSTSYTGPFFLFGL